MIKVKTLIIIQARMGSSRLPGKVLKPLGETVVLDYVVTRCQKVDKVSDVIVATSTKTSDDPIESWCKEKGVSYFRGSELDVLSRYYECARQYKPDYVIRVTSDCPFVDYEMTNEMVSLMEKSPADYVKVLGELPRGLVTEIFSFSALKYMYYKGHEPRHREHVTYYGYEFANEFRSNTYNVSQQKEHPKLRVTLDTKEDYQLCCRVADYFFEDKEVSSQNVIDYLLLNPDVAQLNAHIEQKPVN